jgi:esterase/lipase superfamily enzyme
VTLFLNFRAGPVGMAEDPYVLEGTTAADTRTIGWTLPSDRIGTGGVVFGVHGFNVSYGAGVASLAALERTLALGRQHLFVGVLWPGDWWVPAINYPAEAGDAVLCGRRLARFVIRSLPEGVPVSFVAHSLGCRLALEAARQLGRRRVREVCLLAAAVDSDCLATSPYDEARENTGRTSVLSSKQDWVLWLAYPAGDLLADIGFGDRDSPLRRALGYTGPRPNTPEKVDPAPIPDREKVGHTDYLADASANAKAGKVQRYARRAVLGLARGWP